MQSSMSLPANSRLAQCSTSKPIMWGGSSVFRGGRAVSRVRSLPVEDTSAEVWAQRRRKRMVDEILEASKRRATGKVSPPVSASVKARCNAADLYAGIEALESLLPGFTPNLELLSAMQWAELVLDVNACAGKLVALKGAYPDINLVPLVQRYPKVLLFSVKSLKDDAVKVYELLERAKDPQSIIAAVPELITPKILASVLITINKWYNLEKDPVEVLEKDPDLVRRAQEYGTPLEPVYENEDGSWMVPQLEYRARRADWQKYIDKTRYGQD